MPNAKRRRAVIVGDGRMIELHQANRIEDRAI
jgi:hypothetical protein